MVDGGNEPEDVIFERLQEAASGDIAVRQLRRRYELLRQDYERLLDRLTELEEKLAEASRPEEFTAVPGSGLLEAIAAPLWKLRAEYLEAAAGIQAIVSGIEGIAGGLKGQHSAQAAHRPPGTSSTSSTGEPLPERARRVQVDVRGSGFGELLDFQERLSALEGVARVAISAIDNERATLVVELERGKS